MKKVFSVLLSQAFSAQEEKIAILKQENQALINEINALKEKNSAFEQLQNIFDEELTKLKDFVKTYVSKDEEEFNMEEYKYGQK